MDASRMETSTNEQLRLWPGENEAVVARVQLDTPPVYRPIQYLGSKLRSLPHILAAARDLRAERRPIVDLFSGTSVVSQAFATLESEVTAVDTQLACQIMAVALLGVGRRGESIDAGLGSEIVKRADSLNLSKPWDRLLALEDIAIRQQDGAALLSQNERVPLIWATRQKFAPLESLLAAPGRCAVGIAPLFTLTLAGSYFGIRQALTIDSLRWAIGQAQKEDLLTDWQSAALTTALMAAMSKAVCSAGKHFAQPLTAGGMTGGTFAYGGCSRIAGLI
jgi:adenine-specific DNA-methyltransferase